MDAYKLDETIKEFEAEVGKIKTVNEMYLKVDELNKKITLNAESYKKNNEEIMKIKKDLDEALTNNEESLKKLIEFNDEIKGSIKTEIDRIKEENKQFNTGVHEKINSLESSYGEKFSALNVDYEKRFFELRKENRELYQELEKLTSSKLERIKSDIEVNIRDGNTNLEKVIATQFDLKFIQFNELIGKRFEEIQKKMKSIFIVSIAACALIVINIILNVINR